MEFLTALIGPTLFKIGASTLTAILFVFILGLFRKSAGYKGARNAAGKAAKTFGRALSRFGNKKLPIIWEPLEAPILDFGLHVAEQIAVGAREDNIEKLEAHAERLDGVESETRLAGILKKIREVKIDQAIERDPLKVSVDAFSRQSAADKLADDEGRAG